MILKNTHAKIIKQTLLDAYKGAKSELRFDNLYQLLVSVMLSAQCTDKRVNIITPALFKAYPDIAHLAKARLASLKTFLNTCSFFNNKAANLIKMAKKVNEDFSGTIPLDLKGLESLAGVGKKTARVVLIEHCKANFMAVDTHVFRVGKRLGLSDAKTVDEANDDLTKLFKTDLGRLHQAMVLFGRYVCKAKSPKCGECILAPFCPSVGRIC